MRPGTSIRLSSDHLPEQLYDMDIAAVRHLWAAVLARGLQDAALTQKHFHCEPQRWFRDTINRPGSFIWLCELFDLDPVHAKKMWRKNLKEVTRQAESIEALLLRQEKKSHTIENHSDRV